jgi:hypothetical protein
MRAATWHQSAGVREEAAERPLLAVDIGRVGAERTARQGSTRSAHSADDMPALLAALDAGEVSETDFLATLFAAGRLSAGGDARALQA